MSQLVHPLNFKAWIDQHRELLKPPIGNKCVWQNQDFIVMVVGGPNARKDFHYNRTPEFFYQIEGDMILKIQHNHKVEEVPIKEGEIYLLPAGIPHSPQRKKDTVGLVLETARPKGVEDELQWYCEKCNTLLHKAPFLVENIETDMPVLFEKYYANKAACTCKNCGTVMQRAN